MSTCGWLLLAIGVDADGIQQKVPQVMASGTSINAESALNGCFTCLATSKLVWGEKHYSDNVMLIMSRKLQVY